MNKKQPILYVRGISGKTPQHMIDRLSPHIDALGNHHNIDFVHVQYTFPWTSALQAGNRKRTIALAEGLADKIAVLAHHYGVVPFIVCYSFGNVITHRVPWHNKTLRQSGIERGDLKAFLFHAAIEDDYIWSGTYGTIHNFYEPEDKALKYGRKIPFHPFGSLGRTGYKGPDESGQDWHDHPSLKMETKAWNKHDNWFEGINAAHAANKIVKEAL